MYNMTTKQPKTFLLLVLTALVLSFAAVSCNNSAEEQKTPGKDSLPPAAITPPDSMGMKKDSLPMDSADTKPVKTTNEK